MKTDYKNDYRQVRVTVQLAQRGESTMGLIGCRKFSEFNAQALLAYIEKIEAQYGKKQRQDD